MIKDLQTNASTTRLVTIHMTTWASFMAISCYAVRGTHMVRHSTLMTILLREYLPYQFTFGD
jgi:hypothetical protein